MWVFSVLSTGIGIDTTHPWNKFDCLKIDTSVVAVFVCSAFPSKKKFQSFLVFAIALKT